MDWNSALEADPLVACTRLITQTWPQPPALATGIDTSSHETAEGKAATVSSCLRTCVGCGLGQARGHRDERWGLDHAL